MEERTVDRPGRDYVITGNNPDLEFVVMLPYYDQGHLHMVSYCRVNPNGVNDPNADTVHTINASGWLRMMKAFEGKVKPRK